MLFVKHYNEPRRIEEDEPGYKGSIDNPPATDFIWTLSDESFNFVWENWKNWKILVHREFLERTAAEKEIMVQGEAILDFIDLKITPKLNRK
jgi:hypothetical protein